MKGISRTSTRIAGLIALTLFVAPWAASAKRVPIVKAQELGTLESALAYCTPIDAAAAAKLKAKIDQLLSRASEEDVAEVRASEEYKVAYETVTELAKQMASENPARVCSLSLNATK